ncbi:hypothetical protein B4168_0255 [Anoxybacillus flavithermus]|nr:hypothetical protein B4168_0255 [Anoxybacillus flavithermus]OAO88831.1 hypothetical protein GT23_0071 [Parageobacillus thermoglucosidasius]
MRASSHTMPIYKYSGPEKRQQRMEIDVQSCDQADIVG